MIVPTFRNFSVLCVLGNGSSAYWSPIFDEVSYSWKPVLFDPSIVKIPVSKHPDKPLMLLCDSPGSQSDLIIIDDVTREYTVSHAQRLQSLFFVDADFTSHPVLGDAYNNSHYVHSLGVTSTHSAPLYGKDWLFITDYMSFKVPKSDLKVVSSSVPTLPSPPPPPPPASTPVPAAVANTGTHRSVRLFKTKFPEIYKAEDGSVAYIPSIDCAKHMAFLTKSLNEGDSILVQCKFDENKKRWIPLQSLENSL